MHTQPKIFQSGFENLSIVPALLHRLTKIGYLAPTPIQERSIPLLIEGKDILGVAQTGTGKTLAFALPLIQRIARLRCRALVLVPTRELALQVNETFEKIGHGTGLKTAVLIGGADISRQIKSLRANPHVLIGTPGRIIDHLARKSLKLGDVRMLVLDEADLMLDMGFAPQIKRILETVPAERQTMLFSATMPPAIQKITASYMSAPVHIEVARSGTLAERIEQEIHYVAVGAKTEALIRLLRTHKGTTIVFLRTKHGAKKLTYALKGQGFRAAEIHSNRSLRQRRAALEGFKTGKIDVLVATDIAARGIDVSGIGMVVNYDLPENPEDYVHRIGRTGRAGKGGRAVSFATPGQQQLVRRIERLTGITIDATGEKHLPPTPLRQSRKKFMRPRRYAPSYGGERRKGFAHSRYRQRVASA